MKLLLLVFTITVLIPRQCVHGDESALITSCVSKGSCAECIQTAGCSWCNQEDFIGKDKRCNSTAGHANLGRFRCAAKSLYTPINLVDIRRDDDVLKSERSVPIKPQRLGIKLRPGVPIEIDVTLFPEDYPLDLYYLMDLTKTMEDDKVFLSKLGDQLGQRLQNMTKKFREGFGSFVDKVAMPYVRMTPAWLNNPCLSVGESCIKPYGFKHHLSLSSDLQRFEEEVRNAPLSGSSDAPEGGFDALMQTMVCEQIGWSSESRKVVIFATDAPFHIAGDGKLGGIIRRNDGKCHLNNNGEYTHSTEMDYPSIGQLNHESIQNSVIVIFAVTKDHINIYKQLAARIEGATSAVLSSDSSNIVDLVVQEYQKIKSEARMSDSFPKQYMNITYFSKCIDRFDEKQTDVCYELPVDKPVTFKVKIELTQCPTNKEDWKEIHKIYRVGRLQDALIVELEMLCDCPCENEENWIKNSPDCNRHGTQKCGLCSCYESFFGNTCQCNAKGGIVPVDEIKECTPENATEVCSGRGNCRCGQCECSTRPNKNEIYSGRFCECDNFSCEISNGEICANHGICNCGKCECNSEWTGVACDCSTDDGTCVKTGSDDICSKNGKCECGKCVCEGKYTGNHCEKCFHESCPTRCEELTPCVQCKAFGTGEYENAGDCDLKCYAKPITILDVIPQETSSEDEVLCKAEDSTDQCTFYFVYDQTLNEPTYIRVQKTKECPPKPPIFWILVAIISIIVVVGVCLIIAWKVYAVVSDQREYARFESETKKAAFRNTENPLYHNPVATYQNPMYGKQTKQ